MTSRHLPGWLAGLFIATLALGTDEFVIAGLLPALATDLAVSTGAAGQLITVFAVAFALGAPVMAVVLEPYPRRRVMVTGLAVFIVANLAAALAPTFAILLALRVLAGLAAAVVSSTAFAIAAQAAPPKRQGRFLAVVTAGLTVALFTGVPAGASIGAIFGWRSAFLLIAVVAVGALGLLSATLPPLPRTPGPPAASLRERLSPLRDVRVLRLVLAVFLSGTGGLMFYSYLSALLTQHQGTTAALPWVLLLVGVVGVPSALLGGTLADRYGPRRSRLTVIGGHAVALAVATLVLVAGAPLPVLLASIAAWSAFAWALNPPLQASTIDVAPETPMTAISLNISGLYLGTAAAAGLGGMIVDGPGALWIPAAATLALALAAVSASFRTPRPVPTYA